MKRILLFLSTTILLNSKTVSISGFFTNNECLIRGEFKDCLLSTYNKNNKNFSGYVLYVHSKHEKYDLIINSKKVKIDYLNNISLVYNQNNVTVIGSLEGTKIIVNKIIPPITIRRRCWGVNNSYVEYIQENGSYYFFDANKSLMGISKELDINKYNWYK